VRCEEQNRLLKLYRAAVSEYSATVNDLAVTRGKITLQEYNRLLAVSEKLEQVQKRGAWHLRGTRKNTAVESKIWAYYRHRLR
jgi:hypothetical protein